MHDGCVLLCLSYLSPFNVWQKSELTRITDSLLAASRANEQEFAAAGMTNFF